MRRGVPKSLLWLGPALLLGAPAALRCVPSPVAPMRACEVSFDCARSEQCIEGRCVAAIRSRPPGLADAGAALDRGSESDAEVDLLPDADPDPSLPADASAALDASPIPDTGPSPDAGPSADGSTPRTDASLPVDAGPSLLALNAACTADADCASDVCFNLGGATVKRCVQSCGRSTDCPSGFSCLSFDGAWLCLSAQLRTPAPSYSVASGAACNSDGDCRSNLCLQNVCVERCTKNLDCPAGRSCAWDQYQQETFRESCTGPLGSRAPGNTCSRDTDCRSGVCYDDLGTGRCGDPCTSVAGCGSNEICVPIDYSWCTQGIPASCQNWRVQTVKTCVHANHGAGAAGAACNNDGACRSGFCSPRLNQCIEACGTNADCPTTHRCKVEKLFTLPGNRDVIFNACLPSSR